ncbi:UDP-N-acetylmuramate--L-alanine ligase [Neolewinella antarctica]|uniref:UDP-N-acetylmuramate--L-alanine ligase n=1 Tax=Neolewinella antarctica TaxID=442734 RepID=A0ABX0X8G9_9BACT|nr:UDP-N-acetylmuramate--L-alanine ligase [Neolewinella antarctica]NJC25281.1 UDP-N-acetylmuramate--alanine ligase [Neolewinella antarctica]
MMDLKDIEEVYFIGIGGIGMSSIARYFTTIGVKVSGYDKTPSALTATLEEEGISIHFGEAAMDKIPPASPGLLIVFTPAVPSDFAERIHVDNGDYVVLKRAQVLGIISRATNCVAIAGTHGKTTTTTMTAHLMTVAGLEPKAFLGGISRNFNSNYVHGTSDWVVVEADEYDRSFLQLDPTIAVILSADPDHLDIYGDHATMLEEGFRAFAKRIIPGGQLLVRHEIAHLFSDLGDVLLSSFGIGAGDFCAQNIHVRDGCFYFDLHEPDGHMVIDLRTELPGRHNVENAVAACAVTRLSGGSEADIRRGLATFKGISRRFEKVFDDGKLVIIDDYAHHPTELNAAINAARELYPGKVIRGVFQPHLFSRTQDFAGGFAEALDQLDQAILIPIYPAREKPLPGVTSQLVFNKMKADKKRLFSNGQMLEWAKKLNEGVLLLLGAGDIDALIGEIAKYHKNYPPHGSQ